MPDRFLNLHMTLSRHRVLVAVCLAGTCAIAALLALRLEMDEDVMRMLPQHDPAVRDYVQAFKKLRHIDGVIVDVGTAQEDNDALFRAADQMASHLEAIPEFLNVDYRYDMKDYPGTLRLLHTSLPNLIRTDDEYRRLSESITTNAIQTRLNWIRQSLTQPQGFVVKDIARIDPVGLSTIVMQRMAGVQAGMGDAHIVEGRVVSGDNKHVLIRALPNFETSDLEKSRTLVAALLDAAATVENSASNQHVHVAIGGGHRVGLDNSRLIKRDVKRAVSIAVVAMFVLSSFAYRRRWLAIITLLPTFVGASLAGSLLFVIGAKVSGIAIGCGTILLGITVDYAIHVIYHIDNSAHQSRKGMVDTIMEIARPIGFGAVTTLGAFLVMMLSPVESHRQVGLFAAVGVAAAAVVSIVLLPLFVPLNRGTATPLVMTRAFERFFAWRARHRYVLVVLVVAFSLPCLYGLSRLRFDGDLAALNGVTPEMEYDQQLLWDTWGDAASMTTVLVTAPDRQTAMEKNDQAAVVLDALQQDGKILSYSSLHAICPSAKEQAHNVETWKQFWTPSRKAELRDTIKETAPACGFRAESLLRTCSILDDEPVILAPEQFRGTLMEQLLKEHLHENEGEVFISSLVHLPSPSHHEDVAAAVRAQVPDAVLLNRVAFSNHIARMAKRGLATFALIVTIMVTTILFILLGKLSLVLAALLPILWGLGWTFGVLGMLNVPVNIINFIFVIFVIGIGIDYSLFLVTASVANQRGEMRRMAITSGSIVVCSLTTMCGFGVLAIARHPALFSVGITAFLGMLFSLISTLVLVPMGVDLIRPTLPPSRE